MAERDAAIYIRRGMLNAIQANSDGSREWVRDDIWINPTTDDIERRGLVRLRAPVDPPERVSEQCDATHTVPTMPDWEPWTVGCDRPTGHAGQHRSDEGGIYWGEVEIEDEPEAREGGRWVSSDKLTPYEIAFAATRCRGWDWFVNRDGLGWAFIPDSERVAKTLDEIGIGGIYDVFDAENPEDAIRQLGHYIREAEEQLPGGWMPNKESRYYGWSLADRIRALRAPVDPPDQPERCTFKAEIAGVPRRCTRDTGHVDDHWVCGPGGVSYVPVDPPERVSMSMDEYMDHHEPMVGERVSEQGALNLPGHQCEPIADFGRFMNEMGQAEAGEREWWIGRLTEPIDGFPQEKWCFHIRTPLKPEIVFGFNEADLNYMAATVWAALGYHTSHAWVENIGGSAMKKAGQEPHDARVERVSEASALREALRRISGLTTTNKPLEDCLVGIDKIARRALATPSTPEETEGHE